MQELIFHIAYMERRKYQDEQTTILGGMNDCIMNDAIIIQSKVIEELTKEYAEYLEKEKEQTRLAFFRDGHEYWDNITFEEYYNQTYNQTNVGNDGFEFDNSSTIPPPKTNNQNK